MRAHYLQHVPFEGLGSIEPWLRAAGYEITNTHYFESTRLPDPNDVDLLVVMGGPMSANDEGELPWLVEEKLFIRSCIQSGKSVLGICLGAQLIASSMGARVYRNHVKEIGWFPVQGMPLVDGSIFRFPPAVEAFHWHGETFDLPRGAVRIARSEGCENQAFQIGQSVIGLQFHLETTPASAQEIVSYCRAELLPSKYVQSETAILAAASEKYRAINDLMAKVLSFLTGIDGNQRLQPTR
jgi:GMP synthase-like glutamine amidotransferase